MRLWLCAFFFCFCIACIATAQKTEEIDFWTDMPPSQLAQTLADSMSDEELLAQILMFGWSGAEPGSLLTSWVSERGLGSVKVFGWNTDNIQQVACSVKNLQQEAASGRFKIPLFVATDQEGGWVRHVKGAASETPGNMAIGASGLPVDAYYSSYYINREIKALGINMNFAPVVDLYTNKNSTVIGPRSFSSSPSVTSVLAQAFTKGCMDAGVIPTAKHFPGHGDTRLDSHGHLPEIDIDYDTWTARELLPFQKLIQSGIPAIMSGHISFPQIDVSGAPASLSSYFLTDILRHKLGYEGLVITDDMMMNGATQYAGSFSRACTLAIQAGNDIIISSETAAFDSPLWKQNLSLMATNAAFRERVKESAMRILYAKLLYFKGGNAAPLYPDETELSNLVQDREGQRFFLEQACRSISIYSQGEEALPLRPGKNEKVLLVGAFPRMFEQGKKRYGTADTFSISYSLASDKSNYSEWNAAGLETAVRPYSVIVFCVFDKHSAEIAKRLRKLGKKVYILSVLSPVPVMEGFEWTSAILCGYSYSDYSFNALFAALNGEISVSGTIPLSTKP